jgi:single-strand DNA-binding protein
MYLNKAIVIGNLTKDPELKALPSGIKVCSFSVATNRVYKDKNGVRQESADYHNVVVFGRQAETTAQYMKKGSNILVEGRMQTRSWDAQDGSKKYRTEIVADRIQFGNRGPASEGSSSSSAGTKGSPSTKGAKAPVEDIPNEETIDYPIEDINTEEIPF